MSRAYQPTATPAWKQLAKHAGSADTLRLTEMFAADPHRRDRLTLEDMGITVDLSRNLVDAGVLEALWDLADDAGLGIMIEAMFRGDNINTSEDRPALHTALRASGDLEASVPPGVMAATQARKSRIQAVSDAIRSGAWKGVTGETITDVVHLGIGGSDLGPRMVCRALGQFAGSGPRVHFVANVDGEVIHSTLSRLNPSSTLIIVCSKSFTTRETQLNALAAADWFRDKLGLTAPMSSGHFVAVTAAEKAAREAGIPDNCILTFEQWVGGRFSLWSPVGLVIAIALGFDNFQRLLDGASAMDEHFANRPWNANIPVMLALMGLWYHTFLKAESHAILPYCDRLGLLPAYVQQLDMESNGKSVDRHGKAVDYATGPVIWGGAGTDCQHSFFQLIHQGSHLIPLDFIGVVDDPPGDVVQHRVLLASMVAQGAALMAGRDEQDEHAGHRRYPGNKPSTTILLDELSPERLGSLIAMYEHKVCAQGWLWNINSFDQWGVELGKTITESLLAGDTADLDPSSAFLAQRLGL